jgi:cell division protein FtsB
MSHRQKIVAAAIVCAMFGLMLVITFGDNGLLELSRMRVTLHTLVTDNERLVQENARTYRTIERLQKDPAMIEDVARRELGMIRDDERIFKFKSGPDGDR